MLNDGWYKAMDSLEITFKMADLGINEKKLAKALNVTPKHLKKVINCEVEDFDTKIRVLTILGLEEQERKLILEKKQAEI
ncbi:hypothetical protein [Streptobacillus moniliformis]|uniref:hypothetical protein n=1 Tax=Streptobacillus moniliformis TaxID=34105 RepID=UPI0007E404AB|nr:hypothetical protein [Streptobacillus moniliformis]